MYNCILEVFKTVKVFVEFLDVVAALAGVGMSVDIVEDVKSKDLVVSKSTVFVVDAVFQLSSERLFCLILNGPPTPPGNSHRNAIQNMSKE